MKTAELFVTETTLVSVFRRATLAIFAKLQSTLSTLLNVMLVCLRNLRFTLIIVIIHSFLYRHKVVTSEAVLMILNDI